MGVDQEFKCSLYSCKLNAKAILSCSVNSSALTIRMLFWDWVTCRVIFTLCVFVSSAHSQAAVSMLKQDYKEGEMTLSSALALAVKVLNKTMDVSKLSAEKGADLSIS